MRKGIRRGIGLEERYGLAGRGVTHRTLAALAGCSRETVTRVLAGQWDDGPTAQRVHRALELVLAEPPEAFIRDREVTLVRIARRMESQSLLNQGREGHTDPPTGEIGRLGQF